MSASSMPGSQRTITAFFDHREDANEAVERLVSAGIARSDVTLVEGGQTGTQGETQAGGQGNVSGRSYPQEEGTGFWEALKNLFMPDEDRHTYAEGLRRGGYLVTVRATEAQYERAIDILDDEGTVDMNERESAWRQEGWTGYSSSRGTSTAGTGLGTAGMGSETSSLGPTGGPGLGTTSSTGLGSTGSTGPGATGSTTSGLGATGSTTDRTHSGTTDTNRTAAGRDETIQLAEEQLRVGKRDVNEGRVRVRSYVVEQPVQEQVNLRQEHVSVERHPVDRPATGTENLFQDRTIEAEEKSEQADVSKEARVKEELVVNKDVENRTETVSDTVRRTEVEVEDERGDRLTGTTGTTGTSTDRNR